MFSFFISEIVDLCCRNKWNMSCFKSRVSYTDWYPGKIVKIKYLIQLYNKQLIHLKWEKTQKIPAYIQIDLKKKLSKGVACTYTLTAGWDMTQQQDITSSYTCDFPSKSTNFPRVDISYYVRSGIDTWAERPQARTCATLLFNVCTFDAWFVLILRLCPLCCVWNVCMCMASCGSYSA